MSTMTCPICNEGTLAEATRVKTFTRPHGEVSVDLLYSHCEHCGSDLVTEEQSRNNKKRMRAREKQYDGYLTGQQIFALRRRYNLTQKEAGKLFGGGPVAFSKYESEDIVPTDAMNKLLWLAINLPESVDRLATLVNIDLKGATTSPRLSMHLLRAVEVESTFCKPRTNKELSIKNLLRTVHPAYEENSSKFADGTTQLGEFAANETMEQLAA
jgi:HTH-type transcriptional regulator / antitoxin MqsA